MTTIPLHGDLHVLAFLDPDDDTVHVAVNFNASARKGIRSHLDIVGDRYTEIHAALSAINRTLTPDGCLVLAAFLQPRALPVPDPVALITGLPGHHIGALLTSYGLPTWTAIPHEQDLLRDLHGRAADLIPYDDLDALAAIRRSTRHLRHLWRRA